MDDTQAGAQGTELFSDIQVRVLGCLLEKEATTPDQYPLTANALKNACNQKSNRFPITDYEQGQLVHTLRGLEARDLVREVHGARVARYEHRLNKSLELHSADAAVLCVLMLRGAQTVAEIRARCQRIHAFDDNDDVEYVLKRLAEREPPMAMRLPRAAGQKEDRFHHLLAGEPDLDELPVAKPAAVTRADLEQRVSQLEIELAELRARVDRVDATAVHPME